MSKRLFLLTTGIAATAMWFVACSSAQPATTANPAEPDPTGTPSEKSPSANEGGAPKDSGHDSASQPKDNDAAPEVDAGVDAEPPLTGPISGPAINGCTQYEVGTTITWTSSRAFPICIAVRKGTSVEWVGDFDVHPLEQFPITAGSPITTTETGGSQSFTFSNEGAFGFHCAVHAKMKGAIYVVP